MGRHAASGSDGVGHRDGPVTGGRRRTDAPDGPWAPLPPGDDRTAPGPSRRGSAQAPVASSPGDGAVPIPRSRLPLPPVPAGPGSPRSSAFPAFPTPELPGGPAGSGRLPSGPLQRTTGESGPAVLPRPARVWPQGDAALVSTGPGPSASGARGSAAASRLPRQTAAALAPSPAYSDWTKPSSSGPIELDLSADASGRLGVRVPVAPATTAIPERPLNRNRRVAAEDVVDRPEPAVEAPGRGTTTGPVTGPGGGRAAMRAQRQAIDAARRKAAKRAGDPVGVPDDEPSRGPRRMLTGLVAVVVVALGVLGVYTVVPTEEAASGTPVVQDSAPEVPAANPVLPPLDGDLEVEVPAAPATPVLAPVTVLNATDVNGLAADVAGVLAAGGWETPGVGTYLADDIATSTVFYTGGDETQRQAAESLKAQYPQLLTVAERFFEVPGGVAAPGLVVVVTAPW